MKRALSFIFVLTTSFVLFAYQQPVQEEMKVNLVELEVKVKNLKGRFVSGLTPASFVVKENGAIKEIDSFEEVELYRLPEGEKQDYKSRIMILLDFKNTSYPLMRRVFRQVEDYVELLYTGNTELGLAVNANGIYEITGFTEDPEVLMRGVERAKKLHSKTRSRAYNRANHPGFSIYRGGTFSNFITPYPYRLRANDLYQQHVADYYRGELEVLGQFVRYLGGYSGKKNLVLISETWKTPLPLDDESNVDREGVISLKDIQTTCVREKIAVNVISLSREPNLTVPTAFRSGLSDRFFDRGADLAAATSGNYYLGNQMNVSRLLERTLENAEQYYRIRYYSEYGNPKFRRVKVKVKGANLVASTFGGYFPAENSVRAETAQASLSGGRDRVYRLEMDTDWMRWEWAGWKKRRANYAIGQRVYDEDGRIVLEKVEAGELEKRKYQGAYEQKPLLKDLVMKLPPRVRAMRVEIEVIDLTSGKKVVLSKSLGKNLI